jgi:hypothetical protein
VYSRNAGYNSVQTILSFQLLSIKPNKIYKTAVLPVVGMKAWSHTPREEHRFRVLFEFCGAP